MAWASRVAVVVPSPAMSLVLVATSRTSWAPWLYFRWGVYGEVSEDRNDLSRKALGIITERDGPIDPRRMVVIGDTVSDIRCGQAIGATTIAYSAGFEPAEKLLPANPDHITDDFRHLPAIIEQAARRL